METLCLVSSAFRDIALEVACKAFGIQREEGHPNYPRYAYDCDGGRCANVTTFFSSSSTEPALVFAKLWLLQERRLTPMIVKPIKDDLVSGYTVYMTVVDMRLNSIYESPDVFLRGHQLMLPLVETVLTHCGTIEPLGVAEFLRSLLSDEIGILKIGTTPTSYLWGKDIKSSLRAGRCSRSDGIE